MEVRQPESVLTKGAKKSRTNNLSGVPQFIEQSKP